MVMVVFCLLGWLFSSWWWILLVLVEWWVIFSRLGVWLGKIIVICNIIVSGVSCMVSCDMSRFIIIVIISVRLFVMIIGR